jgi:hypothetical protein
LMGILKGIKTALKPFKSNLHHIQNYIQILW